MTLAVVVTGGFLFAQSSQTAHAADTFTQVFSDNFNRADGAIGNNWQLLGGGSTTYNILGNQVMGSGTSVTYQSVALRPTSENFQDGKIELDFASLQSGNAIALYARGSGTATSYTTYYAWLMGNGYIRIYTANNQAIPGQYSQVCARNGTAPGSTGHVELTVKQISRTQTQVTLNHYDTAGGTLIDGCSATSSTTGLQRVSGQWGFSVSGATTADNVTISKLDVLNDLTADKTVLELGDVVNLSVIGDISQVVSLSALGGGTFDYDSITVDGANWEDVTYTPIVSGLDTITATFADGSTKTVNINVREYSGKIGFIGNSITAAAGGVNSEITILGSGYSAVNQGVSGSRITAWGSGSANLNTALAAFQSAGVEIVQIMHGTNDARTSGGTSAEDYADYLDQIITELKGIGVKKIILNTSPYPKSADTLENLYGPLSLELLAQYDAVMRATVDGEIVMLGDTTAYSQFEANKATWFADGLHPNATGYAKLGEMWANAYYRVIEEPLTIVPEFTGSIGNTYTQQTSVGLEYTIDKDITWFDVGTGNFSNVLVDGDVVDPANYTAVSGSTVITLSPAYLNGLNVGAHSLTVRFADGVNFTSPFSVLAANNNGGAPGVPNTGSTLIETSGASTTNNNGIVAIISAIIALVLGSAVVVRRRVSR